MAKLDPKAAGAALAAMLAIATPFVAKWEGMRLDPYRDLVGVQTVCAGETRVQMRRYTQAECQRMLAKGLQEFGMGVAERNPELIGHANQWSSAASLSFNIGQAAYNKSTVAKLFSAGRWKEACDGFLSWDKARVGGKLVRVKGLVNRRHAERALCRTGL